MKPMKKKMTASLIASLLLLAGCGGGTIGGDEKKLDESHEFQIILNAAWSGFSPLKTNDAASTNITAQVYETLYRRSTDGKEFIPVLAKELPQCNEEGTSCTIKLRENVKFQDGTDFNSEAVKYVLEKIKNPDSGAARASIAASIESIETPDANTIILNTAYPDGVLTAKLAHTNSAIFSPTADQKQDLMIEPVGTGPYKFVSTISGSEVKLTRNDEYWGEKPAIKDAKFTVVPEPSTAISRLETGEADLMPDVPVTQTERVKSIKNVTFMSEESARTTFLAMRTDTAAHPDTMTDLETRKAIAYAIDPQGYITTLGGNATHSNSLLGPLVFGYSEAAEKYGYQYNLEEAKKIVAEKGLADKEIVFVASNVASTQTLAEYVQSNLKAAGFNNVKVEPLEYTAYLAETKTAGRFDITLLSWSNVTGDGTEYLEPNFSPENSSKRVQWNSSELETLIKEGKQTIDNATRLEKLGAADKLLLDNAIAVPLYNQNKLYAFNNAFDNVKEDPSQQFYLNDITFK